MRIRIRARRSIVMKRRPVARYRSTRSCRAKELSYNNVADADAAWECVRAFADTCCVIVKHANPCGGAGRYALPPTTAPLPLIRLRRSAASSPSTALSMRLAQRLSASSSWKCWCAGIHRRCIGTACEEDQCAGADCALRSLYDSANAIEMKRVGGGLLVQSADTHRLDPSALKVVTSKAPTAQQLKDMQFVWTVAQSLNRTPSSSPKMARRSASVPGR